jgi:hypothetical protein
MIISAIITILPSFPQATSLVAAEWRDLQEKCTQLAQFQARVHIYQCKLLMSMMIDDNAADDDDDD